MTYPGLPGQVGPPPTSTVGWQLRQSRAGTYPGTPDWDKSGVLYGMGSKAPEWAVTAAAITVLEQVAEDPHPLAGDE